MGFKTTLLDAVSRADDISLDGFEVTNAVFPPDRPTDIRIETCNGDEYVHLPRDLEIEVDEGGDAHFNYVDEDGQQREAYMSFEVRRPLQAP